MKHEFVNLVPKVLEDDILYVSIPYSTAIHKCCCGCGEKVVTPISPTDWKLIYDGETVSLNPSIGNWGFKCKSHYFIKKNKIIWAGQWSQEEIEKGRKADKERKKRYYHVDRKETFEKQDDSNELGFVDSLFNRIKQMFKS